MADPVEGAPPLAHTATATVRIRFLFADSGVYREETVELPGGALDQYDRLIDWLREDEAVLKVLHVDLDRVCAASLES